MYSPKITTEDLIKRLYRLRKSSHKPMTRMVTEAVEQYLEAQEKLLIKPKKNKKG